MNEGNNRAADLSGLNMPTHDSVYWFVMRDLKRPNAKLPAYKRLAEIGFEVFTPMRWHIATRGGKRPAKEGHDAVFVARDLYIKETNPGAAILEKPGTVTLEKPGTATLSPGPQCRKILKTVRFSFS